LRSQTLVYVEYASEERELYDLTTDPYQIDNLAATADPLLLSNLSARLAELTACAGETCRLAEDAPAVPPLVASTSP
jgi:hypothetical protein